jgi:hypothetical protein
MKPLFRNSVRLVVCIAAFTLALGTGATAAYALLDSYPVPLTVSSTNPYDDTSPELWWRQGWGNNPYPQFILTLPDIDPELEPIQFVSGTLYAIDRDPSNTIDTTQPNLYYRTARGQGTNISQTLDLPGTLAYPPFDTMPLQPGATQAIEGTWYYHYVFFSNLRYSSTQLMIPVGIDVTPPDTVVGLSAAPAITVPADPDAWVASTRAHISWTPGTYDALSGDAYYQVLIDDKPVIPEDGGSAQGRAYVIPGLPTPDSITVENMPPGRHKVSIAVVDRATNQGVPADTYFNSDPDVPTLSLTVPSFTGRYAQLLAIAGDAGGVRSVDFAVNGIPVGQITAPPYALTVDMQPFGPGTHIFSATVTDMFGRTKTAFADATGDPNAGFKTGISSTINGFSYPDANGLSPLRYFNTRSVDVSLFASRTVDAFVYTLSRSVDSSPTMPSTPGEPPSAQMAVSGESAARSLLSLDSWQAVQTVADSTPGAIDAIEGSWYLTARALASSESPPLSGSMRKVQFMIDVTPPRAPTGLVPVDGLPTSTWTPSSRRDVQWNNPIGAGFAAYDGLSGDAYYVVTLNGAEFARPRPVITSTLNYLSFDSLRAGANVVGVSVVDNAGNRGPETKLSLMVDPDVPTVSNTTADRVGRYAALSCVAADQAGIAGVRWTVDGVDVGTATSAPYGLTVDMARFGVGLRTVVATAVDMGGRTAVSSKSVTVVNVTLPAITRVADAADPFYPIKHDHYRDTATISYRLAERAYVRLQIIDSTGAVVREIAGWRNAGANSFVWNGRRTNGQIIVGRYSYRLIADDGSYNVYTSVTGSTTIRSYYLRRISRSRVRVVFS